MALIHCRECGREISDKAAACPNCGAPPRTLLELLHENNKKVAVASFVIIVAVTVAAMIFQKRQVYLSYEGRSLQEWAADLSDASPDVRARAAKALAQIGASGADVSVPALEAAIKSPRRVGLSDADLPPVEFGIDGEKNLVDAQGAARIECILALARLGPVAKGATTTLIAVLHERPTEILKIANEVDRMKSEAATDRSVQRHAESGLLLIYTYAAERRAVSKALVAIGRPSVPPLPPCQHS
ncbi:zinc ribbon domain-containing protein [bacterium]|nr:zinc ribbon domain-containing protein [bacterium]